MVVSSLTLVWGEGGEEVSFVIIMVTFSMVFMAVVVARVLFMQRF
jgi:hypothetical protein